MNKYHKRFLNSFTSENIIGLFSRYNNAAKEITESYGMFQAAKSVIKKIGDYLVIVVGDGCSPRTGAIFAYFTKAEVISVDPGFNLPHWYEHYDKQTKMGFEPQRLTVLKEKIEDVPIDCKEKPCLVLWPHSHADMLRTNIHNHSGRIDIAMPCCKPIPAELMKLQHITYDDYDVLSPKRTIHIWGEENHE